MQALLTFVFLFVTSRVNEHTYKGSSTTRQGTNICALIFLTNWISTRSAKHISTIRKRQRASVYFTKEFQHNFSITTSFTTFED